MPGRLFDIFPDSDALLSLEPEELAGIVLEFLNSLGHAVANQLLNAHNFSSIETADGYPSDKKREILNALMEAWVWLEREGLLAPRPGSLNEGWVFITRRGRKIQNRQGFQLYHHSNLLPKNLLHPVIAQKVWSEFIRGDYDVAVFQSFKAVEVAVHEASGLAPNIFGVDLMRQAFHKETGPLTDLSLPIGEREACQHLFAGAIGLYKNPQSHRDVSITDPTEAVEMIMLASHLLKIVDARHGVSA